MLTPNRKLFIERGGIELRRCPLCGHPHRLTPTRNAITWQPDAGDCAVRLRKRVGYDVLTRSNNRSGIACTFDARIEGPDDRDFGRFDVLEVVTMPPPPLTSEQRCEKARAGIEYAIDMMVYPDQDRDSIIGNLWEIWEETKPPVKPAPSQTRPKSAPRKGRRKRIPRKISSQEFRAARRQAVGHE